MNNYTMHPIPHRIRNCRCANSISVEQSDRAENKNVGNIRTTDFIFSSLLLEKQLLEGSEKSQTIVKMFATLHSQIVALDG